MDVNSRGQARSGIGRFRWRLLGVAAASLALSFPPVPGAAGADSTFIFPAGFACSFQLQVDITGGPQVTKSFQAPDGSTRALSAGKGSDLLFTNLDTPSHTFALSGNGAVSWTKTSAAGSTRLTLTGNNVVFYFPTDDPAGPST